MNKYIYLDYAATSPVDPQVANKMQLYLTNTGIFGNPSSGHIFGRQARNAIEEARQQIAALVGADATEIIFTSGATESNNFALKNVAELYQQKGKHIVTLNTEHKSVLACCQYLEKQGFNITYLSPEKNGILDLNKFEESLRPETIMVSIMHVNNELGVFQDLETIATITQSRNILLHVDAAQSVGKIAIDLTKTPIDLMSLSAHKIYGPKGVGAIYVRKASHIKMMAQIHGGDQENGLRSGTLANHQIIGMGEAFAIAKKEMQNDINHNRQLRSIFLKGLEPFIIINGDASHTVPNILNVRFKSPQAINLLSRISDIAASTASACHGNSAEISYVLRAIGLNEDEALRSIRFSFGRFTTEAEIHTAVEQIRKQL